MDDEDAVHTQDQLMRELGMQDLSALSAGDLKDRIGALRAEISRCEAAMGDRLDTRAAAESVFKI